MTYRTEARWFLPGYKVYLQTSEPWVWTWMASFRYKDDADRYVMNLNGAERGEWF